jgi:CheY-like chemotaxis protein
LIRLCEDKREAVERVYDAMERQVVHMVRLVDDLLDVSRITSGKIRLQRQPTALATLIDTAIEANRAALDMGELVLRLDVPDGDALLDVDPTRFVQVISNLLHNAIKFTPAGGQVEIVARLTAKQPNTARSLTLRVSDTGVGMSEAMLPRVFDLFTQGERPARDKHSGLGIGLALARKLVEMHGGSIEATSVGPDQGSTFTIQLPNSAPVLESAAREPIERPQKLKRRVVVIDDNEDSADTMAMYVSALGADSSVAYDGEEGLSRVLEVHPDLVLLDIGLPGIDGYETCRRIRRQVGSDVTVVAMTGWGQDRDKQDAKDAGFDAHLTKPVDPSQLRRLLADAGSIH